MIALRTLASTEALTDQDVVIVGYYEARIVASRFVVAPDAAEAALAHLLDLARDRFGYDLSDRGLTSLDEFLALFSIGTVREGDGIIALEFEDRLLLETDDVLRALGPYVEQGSYVRMHSGTGQRWRYEYDGRAVRGVAARGVSRELTTSGRPPGVEVSCDVPPAGPPGRGSRPLCGVRRRW